MEQAGCAARVHLSLAFPTTCIRESDAIAWQAAEAQLTVIVEMRRPSPMWERGPTNDRRAAQKSFNDRAAWQRQRSFIDQLRSRDATRGTRRPTEHRCRCSRGTKLLRKNRREREMSGVWCLVSGVSGERWCVCVCVVEKKRNLCCCTYTHTPSSPFSRGCLGEGEIARRSRSRSAVRCCFIHALYDL